MNILVLRFSARGDVALCVPALREAVAIDKKINITFVSRPEFQPFFYGIERLQFIPIHVATEGSFIQLWRFARKVKRMRHFDAILDLHGVYRTRILCFFLNLKTYRINKGRLEKWKMARRKNKVLIPLMHSVERYRRVFKDAGIPVKADNAHYLITPEKTGITPPSGIINIGIAPTSRHHLKEWPSENVAQVIALIKKNLSGEIYILGGPQEKDNLNAIFGEIATVVAGKYSFSEDLEFIQHLDLVVSMDSANMHVAALVGVPVLSIWGPSHPYFGYAPLSKGSKTVQLDYLNCRPCSINGSNPCLRKDHACMIEITPEQVFNELQDILNSRTG
ncbi:MAG: glycosyltransferase family 9 protein [Spirochaetia bacterium]|nr:glycosyltransferase family 9 protein [Spirochaetia bacterium]